MCGIYGFSRYTKRTTIASSVLAYAMEERGEDSWGVARVTPEWNIEIKKGVGPITSSFHDEYITGSYNNTYAGIFHTRAASVGSVTVENAHPFSITTEKGTIVGTHNGCIQNHRELNEKNNTNFPVDSMHIWYYLANGKDTKELHGWGNCAFFVRTPNTISLCLLRFNDASLYYVETERDGIVYASSEDAVVKACNIAFGGKHKATLLPNEKLCVIDVMAPDTIHEVCRIEFGCRQYGQRFPATYNRASHYYLPIHSHKPQTPTRTCLVCGCKGVKKEEVLCKTCMGSIVDGLLKAERSELVETAAG